MVATNGPTMHMMNRTQFNNDSLGISTQEFTPPPLHKVYQIPRGIYVNYLPDVGGMLDSLVVLSQVL